jgi:hypothetical protein
MGELTYCRLWDNFISLLPQGTINARRLPVGLLEAIHKKHLWDSFGK